MRAAPVPNSVSGQLTLKRLTLLLFAFSLCACSDDGSGPSDDVDAIGSADGTESQDTIDEEDTSTEDTVADTSADTTTDTLVDADVAEDVPTAEVGEDVPMTDVAPDVEADAVADVTPDAVADVVADVAPDTPPEDADVVEALTVTDVEGNVYPAVEIGDQVWMAENLRVTQFNDGTPITEYQFGDDWFNRGILLAHWQWADTSDLNNFYEEELPEDFYGAVYNEVVLASGRLAPEGWRMPTVADFEELEAFLESEGQDAHALRSVGGWRPEANVGTDLYGFNALPSGYVSAFGGATGAQAIATWSTTAVDDELFTRTVVSMFDGDALSYDENRIELGATVRLIRE
jgi:uncharacterized protein (TIGR02145 family)